MGIRNLMASMMALVFAGRYGNHGTPAQPIVIDKMPDGPPMRGRGIGKQPYMFHSRGMKQGSGRKARNVRDDRRKAGRGY
jgi:hypothetical protein